MYFADKNENINSSLKYIHKIGNYLVLFNLVLVFFENNYCIFFKEQINRKSRWKWQFHDFVASLTLKTMFGTQTCWYTSVIPALWWWKPEDQAFKVSLDACMYICILIHIYSHSYTCVICTYIIIDIERDR